MPKTVHQLCSLQLDCTGCPQSHGRSRRRLASFVTPTTHASSQHASVSNGSTTRSTALLQTTCCEAWHASGAAAPDTPPAPRPRRLASTSYLIIPTPFIPMRATTTGAAVATQRAKAPAVPASPCITPARICAATSDTPAGVCGRKMVLDRPFAPTSCTGDHAEHVS